MLLGFALLVFSPAAASAGLIVGTNMNITRWTNNQTEVTIAINPVNPQNLFAGANGGFGYYNRVPLPSLFYYSTNGGANWLPSDVSALPTSCCDQSTAWDEFGNLFLVYLGVPNLAIVALSTNGGASFTMMYETSDVVDQPTIVTGPGGAYAPGSVWLSYNDGATGYQAVQGAAVQGFGSVAAFGAVEVAPGGAGGSYGDIAIGPNGEVLVAYQSNTGSPGPDVISVNLDPDGLGPAGFNPSVAATATQVGGYLAIPAQPNRRIDAEAGLAWDRSPGPHRGRVHLVYTDRPGTTSNDTDIYSRYSDDSGSTWSAPLRVNDDPVGNGKSQFLPRIALDQTSGNTAVSFYDCRNSSANNTVEFRATVSVDGGVTWLPNLKVSGGVSSATVTAVSTYKFDFGDYTGLAFHAGIFYPCWGDNSNSTADNPEGTLHTLDACTAAVLVPPLLNMTTTTTNALVLSWPHPSTGFILQENSDRALSSWSNSALIPALVAGHKQVLVMPDSDARVYRLIKP